jgi:pimeloyl-ACP methyl ester carboxylesterase
MKKHAAEERTLAIDTREGVTLSATHYATGSPRLIVQAPGFWRKRRDRENVFVALHLARLGYDVVTFDFRGHGESGGVYTFGREDWKDFVTVSQFFSPTHDEFAAVGFSMGGSIAAAALARRPDLPFRALVMVSSPADFRKLRPRPWKPAAWKMMALSRAFSPPRVDWRSVPQEKPRALEAVEKLPIPKLIVTFEDDWLVKPSHGDLLESSAAPPVERAHLKVGGSLHADAVVRYAPLAFLNVLTNFLGRRFPLPQGAPEAAEGIR